MATQSDTVRVDTLFFDNLIKLSRCPPINSRAAGARSSREFCPLCPCLPKTVGRHGRHGTLGRQGGRVGKRQRVVQHVAHVALRNVNGDSDFGLLSPKTREATASFPRSTWQRPADALRRKPAATAIGPQPACRGAAGRTFPRGAL